MKPPMAAWKGAAIGAGALALLTGILLGTGVISLGGKGGASGSDSDGGKKKRRRRTRKDDGDRGLGYIDETEDKQPGKKGVTHHDKDKAHDGLTLVNPCFRGGRGARLKPVHEAQLWDMEGKMVHKWSAQPFGKAHGWAIARVDDQGFLYFILADTGIAKLDWEGEVVWTVEDVFHHDLGFGPDGEVVVVNEHKREVDRPDPDSGDPVTILDQGFTWLTRDGEVGKKLWLYDALKDHDKFKQVLQSKIDKKESSGKNASDGAIDVFQLNSAFVLPRDVDGLGKKGDVLGSPRYLDLAVSLSKETGQANWVWGEEELQLPHDPTLSKDDKVVIFDNGNRRKRSRVVLVDPKTNEIARAYNGGDDNEFFSSGRGLAQGLPNGNLVVFVSNEARVFEVNADDEIVWDFLGPWITKQGRRPLRGERLSGRTLRRLKDILAGTVDPPKSGVVPEPPEQDDAEPEKADDEKADAEKADDKKADDKKADDKKADDKKADDKKADDKKSPAKKPKKKAGGGDDKAGPK